MKDSIVNKGIYFVAFYLILGNAGVLIPWLSKGWNAGDFAIGLITIVISTVCCSSGVLVLKKLSKFETLINTASIVLSLFAGIVIVIWSTGDKVYIALKISIICYALSAILWWYQNRSNESFVESTTDSVGGDNF